MLLNFILCILPCRQTDFLLFDFVDQAIELFLLWGSSAFFCRVTFRSEVIANQTCKT
jgi:hypothetical protein